MAEFGVAPQAASTSTTSDPMSDHTLQLATQPPEAGVPAPAIMFSDPSDPAPPYAVVAQVAREAAGAPVVNKFFFSMAPDGTQCIRGRFGPALTAMLVSLDVHTRHWPELAACVHPPKFTPPATDGTHLLKEKETTPTHQTALQPH
jgi:hypothetical protein